MLPLVSIINLDPIFSIELSGEYVVSQVLDGSEFTLPPAKEDTLYVHVIDNGAEAGTYFLSFVLNSTTENWSAKFSATIAISKRVYIVVHGTEGTTILKRRGVYKLPFTYSGGGFRASFSLENRGTIDGVLRLSSIDLNPMFQMRFTVLLGKYGPGLELSDGDTFEVPAFSNLPTNVYVYITDLGAEPGNYPINLVLELVDDSSP